MADGEVKSLKEVAPPPWNKLKVPRGSKLFGGSEGGAFVKSFVDKIRNDKKGMVW